MHHFYTRQIKIINEFHHCCRDCYTLLRNKLDVYTPDQSRNKAKILPTSVPPACNLQGTLQMLSTEVHKVNTFLSFYKMKSNLLCR